MQDSLDAHEEFLQSQATYALSEQEPNREQLEAEQSGQGSQSQQLEKDDRDQSVKEDKERGNPDQSAREEASTAAEKFKRDQVPEQDYKKQNLSGGVQFTINETGSEQGSLTERRIEQCDRTHPPLGRAAPPEADEIAPAHCPGPLVTELEDAEQLETIHLPPHRSLRIDDLPDLEDVDTEDFTSVVSFQQVSKPKIEVISGGSDEDEPNWNHSEAIPTVSPDKCFSEASNNSSSLVYADDWDVLEPQIFEPVGKSKTNQTSPPPCCLIEELE